MNLNILRSQYWSAHDVLRAFMQECVKQRKHLFLWYPVCFGMGVVLYFSLRFEPSFIISALICAVLTGGYYCVRHHSLSFFVLFLVLVSAGFCASGVRMSVVYTPILQQKIGPVTLEGDVYHIESMENGKALRLTLDNVEIESLSQEDTPKRVRIKFRSAKERIYNGQRVRALVGISPPSAPLIPGGFDFQRFMFFKSIGAVGFAYGAPEVLSRPVRVSFYAWIQDLRSDLSLGLLERLGPAGGVAAALIVGHKSGIAEADRDAMRHAGLAHVLAISGLHIGLFFGVVFFFSRLLMVSIADFALQYPVKKYAAVLGMAGAIFYMLVAGATVPTQRAVLMMFVVFIALLMDRTALSMRLVAFAALVVLIIAPEALLSVSFQLSFAAVAGLVAFYEAIRPVWSRLHKQAGVMRRCGLYFLGVSMTTIVATLATAPFTLFHFQQLAVYSLIGNVLAMPMIAFLVMPFIVLFFLLLPFGLEGAVLPMIGFGVQRVLDIAYFVSGLDYAVAHGSQWPLALLLLLSAAFIVLTLVEGRLRFMAFIPICMFFVGIFFLKQPDILVSSTSKLFAVYDMKSLSVSSFKTERFTKEQWEQAYGLDKGEVVKWPREGRSGGLSCDENACRFEKNDYHISFVKRLDALGEECAWADIVIAHDPVRECSAPLVHDRFSAKRLGAVALFLDDPLIVKGVEDKRGERPWVSQAQKTF